MSEKKLEIPKWMIDMPQIGLDALQGGLTDKFQNLVLLGDTRIADQIILMLAAIVKLEDQRKIT